MTVLLLLIIDNDNYWVRFTDCCKPWWWLGRGYEIVFSQGTDNLLFFIFEWFLEKSHSSFWHCRMWKLYWRENEFFISVKFSAGHFKIDPEIGSSLIFLSIICAKCLYQGVNYVIIKENCQLYNWLVIDCTQATQIGKF